MSDQELKALFHRHLPHKPMPPELAERLKEQVLAAVAATLQASPRPDAFTLPPEATPTGHFVAEQPDDQELYALFQQHMLHKPLSTAQAVHLQQQVLAAVDTVSSAARPQPTTALLRRAQSQPPVPSAGERWAAWRERFRHLFTQPPALALGGIASVLLVMFVAISLSRTSRLPAPAPVQTPAPTGVPSTAPTAVLRQAHVTITSGQAMIQKPNGQTETLAANTTSYWLAPGDRLITGESTARIEYFPGQSTTVAPGAEVELQEYTKEGATTRVALLVYSGMTSHEVSTPLAAADLFEIRTPAAVASAKYTKLTVEVLSETQTHIETEAGTAEVLTANEEVVIAAGQQITATTAKPWFMTPTSAPTLETDANPVAMPTATATATAMILMRPSEPLLPTSTATADEPTFDVVVNPAPRETAVPAPPVLHIITLTPTPTSLPALPTMTATPMTPPYVMVLVPTATETPLPETPTVLPTSTTAIIDTVEPATDTPTPVDTNTPTSVPVLPTRTSTPTATSTTVLVPTATPTATPTTVLVPTATKTPVPPTYTPTATPTTVLVPTATNTSAPPTYTPTQTTAPTTIPTTVPTVPPIVNTPTNTPAVLPTATNTSAPAATATDTPQPTATSTDTPVPVPTITDTPAPTATATSTDTPASVPTVTDTPVPTATATPAPTATPTDTVAPTATATPESTATPTDIPVPSPTATNTPAPTATPTDTPVPSPTATDTPAPTATPTDTPVPSPTATDTPEPTATDTPAPTAIPTDTPVSS